MAVKLNSTGGGSVTLDSPSTASNYTVTLPSAAGTLATTSGSTFSTITITGSVNQSSATNGYDAYTATRASRSFCWGLDASGNYGIWDTTSGANNRLLIDSSGNLGLGVTPSGWGVPFKAIDVNSGGSYSGTATTARVFGNAYYNGSSYVYKSSTYANYYYCGDGQHAWYNAPSGTAGNTISFTQAMTLDASGNLLVAKTSSSDTTVGHNLYATGAYTSTMASATSAQSTLNVYSTGASAYRFYVDMGGTVHATSAIITAISDQRLKENIQDLDVGLNAILALRPRKFDWRAGKGKDIKGDRGFIAQEFEEVFPDLIDTWKDPAPEGEEPYKSVRQDLIPVLVKAIQELSAQNNALEARLAKLEAK